MSLMTEYISKKWNPQQFQDELIRLIKKYNEIRKTYLLVYVSAIDKPIPEKILMYDDYFVIHDLLRNKKEGGSLDFYLETPGGLGEAAEEIVKLIHNKFERIYFVISGQAKSAGTIMALSGDDIFMTETGSLGPIDAQMKIGRSTISSYDYIEWVDDKRKTAEETGRLNPFDATVIAQITPGELNGVMHADKYARELVVEWLIKYKFRNWKETETRRIPVTDEHKRKTAEHIAEELTNRSRWRTHGRSIKIDDLKELGLRINRIEDAPEIADTVFRIQTVCKILVDQTDTFKILATADAKIFKRASRQQTPEMLAVKGLPVVSKDKIEAIEINSRCEKCGVTHKFYVSLKKNPVTDAEMQKKGIPPLPSGNEFACGCGHAIDLVKIRQEIQKKMGK